MMHDNVAVLPQSTNHPIAHRRTCVLVLGMHRSGTSALARVLNLLGCDLPRNLIGADHSNESGHWESRPVARFNDRLLASAGSTWDDWLAFHPGWHSSPKVTQFHEEASSVLDAEFGNSSFFVLKDPRICRLVPFWMNVLAAKGIAPRILLPVRNPLEVARSLAARNGFEPALGHLMWLRHVLDAEHATRGRPRFFTSYDSLMKDWTSITVGASEALELSWPCPPARVDADIASFLDRKLRHHEEAAIGVLTSPSLSTWLRDAFRIFSDWSMSGERPQDFALLDRIRGEFDAAAPAFVGLIKSGREAIQKNARLLTEKEALTGAVQASEQTIAELQSRLEKLAAHAAKAAELEGAIASTRKNLAAQESAVSALSTERDALKGAVATANDAHQAALARLEASGKAAHVLAEKSTSLESELNKARARELEHAQVMAAARQSAIELSAKLANAEELLAVQRQELAQLQTSLAESQDWVFRMSSERAALAKGSRALERQLAEQTVRLQQSTVREEMLAAQSVDAARRLDEAVRETAALEGSLSAAHAQLTENSVALADERTARKTAERCLADRFDEIAALTGRLDAKEKELTVARGKIVRAVDDDAMAAIRAQIAEKESQLAKRFTEIAALTNALQKTERSLVEKTGELAAAEHALQQSKEVESQLAERFGEIAKLTRLVNDAEAATRKAAAQRDWMREVTSVLANGSRTIKGKLSGMLPAGWRRARQLQQLKESGVFDAEAYFSVNPDVAKSTQDALRHYVRHGLLEDRPLGLDLNGGEKT